MSAQTKKAQQLAKQLFKLSLADGVVSPERVTGVLEYIEKTRPAGTLFLLKHYQRLIAAEIARHRAVVEHGGTLETAVLKGIAGSLTKTYKRPITAVAKPRPSLIAGLRVKIGDDVFESSIAGRLRALLEAND